MSSNILTSPKLIITDLMKKFLSIPSRLEEDYHSIKYDIPFMSVYTTGNVTVRGMLISNAFLTKEFRATDNYKEYETVFVKKQSTTPILPPSDDRERDEITEANLLSLTLQKTTLAAEAQENIAKVQEKLAEEDIEKMIEGEEDEESYASEFADSMFNDDDDSEKKDEKKDDEMDSLENRTEKMQTPIPTTPRSPRITLSSDKNIVQELTDTVSLSTATTSKYPQKEIHISSK
ncbi:hypothetical protein Tco_1315249 [Tanacetum coccineum]